MKKRLEHGHLYRTLKTLDIFVDRALHLYGPDSRRRLFARDYQRDLIYASVANTYLESVSEKADSFHLAIKSTDIGDICRAYINTVRVVGRRVTLDELSVTLAFDYTDEDYYGELVGPWIHGWTGKDAVRGKFKFLTCGIVCTGAPLIVPLISIPVCVGHNMAQKVMYCTREAEDLVGEIRLMLFDRGFYSKELMTELSRCGYRYLIFVPKNRMVKRELESMRDDERKALEYEFWYNRDKHKYYGKTILAFLKRIYDHRSGKHYDWTFATNTELIELDNMIKEYRKRWRIESMFRVHDEARIKSKSRNIKIRFFYFTYSQVLLLLWALIFKQKVGFKEFLIILNEVAREREEKLMRKKKKV